MNRSLLQNGRRYQRVEGDLAACPASVPLNPYAAQVPARFPCYRHGSHHHMLYLVLSPGTHSCDNVMCSRQITALEAVFRCFPCDFDLCQVCFRLMPDGDPEEIVPANFDDRVFTNPLRVVVPDRPDELPGLEPAADANPSTEDGGRQRGRIRLDLEIVETDSDETDDTDDD